MALSEARVRALEEIGDYVELSHNYKKSGKVRRVLGSVMIYGATGAGIVATAFFGVGVLDAWISQGAAKECAITGVSAFKSEPELDELCDDAYRDNHDGYADNDDDIEIYGAARESSEATLFTGLKIAGLAAGLGIGGSVLGNSGLRASHADIVAQSVAKAAYGPQERA
jgi:hypothetical protein